MALAYSWPILRLTLVSITNTGSQGWQTTGGGYLTESEHVYALALFLLLKDMSVVRAMNCLKPNLKKLLKKAVKELSDTNVIAELKAIKYEGIAIDHCQGASL
ncbi:hypothetical protein QWI17_08340 [Gilvimarinus sp. SDUM040013]|uniref:hypothetical protein n=1 Tax=Gilvimarinus gilvus TaxID=3058038 RepID=UPI002670E278|nr:hypothetical protein [Gilvimarinus sp. SDUM040013]MDO3385843.1 hypothetical protein [Gilvimarinus sp. SDUM040013]